MAKLTTHWLKKDQVYHCIRQWQSVDRPKGVIHILHGMMAHSGMYHDWALALCELGWDVVCHDQPGAGFTVHPSCDRGHLPMDGESLLIESVRTIDDWIRDEYPNQKVVRYGHCMGSFLAMHLQNHQIPSDGLILTGATAKAQWLLLMQRLIIKIMGRFLGLKKPATLAHWLRLLPSKPLFGPAHTENICIKDLLCGNTASWGYYYSLNQLLQGMNQCAFKPIPILVISRESDGRPAPWLDAMRELGSVVDVVVPMPRHGEASDQESSVVLAVINEHLMTL